MSELDPSGQYEHGLRQKVPKALAEASELHIVLDDLSSEEASQELTEPAGSQERTRERLGRKAANQVLVHVAEEPLPQEDSIEVDIEPMIVDAEEQEATDADMEDDTGTFEPEDYLIHNDERGSGILRNVRLTADNVKDYLINIGKVPLLSATEEVDLAKKMEAGLFAERILEGEEAYPFGELTAQARIDLERIITEGDAAYDMFLRANLRLVVSLVKRYVGKGLSFTDLIQEGNLGLIRAVQKFDYSKGFKFSTYATWWIKQQSNRAIADSAKTIRLPVHVVDTNNMISKEVRLLEMDLGRLPTDEEILASNRRITPHAMAEYHRTHRQNPISLDAPLGDDPHDGALRDIYGEDKTQAPVEEIAASVVGREMIVRLLSTLPEREARVIIMRFGLDGDEPKKLDEIGQVFGFTRERARQIEKKALDKLREPPYSQILRSFFDW